MDLKGKASRKPCSWTKHGREAADATRRNSELAPEFVVCLLWAEESLWQFFFFFWYEAWDLCFIQGWDLYSPFICVLINVVLVPALLQVVVPFCCDQDVLIDSHLPWFGSKTAAFHPSIVISCIQLLYEHVIRPTINSFATTILCWQYQCSCVSFELEWIIKYHHHEIRNVDRMLATCCPVISIISSFSSSPEVVYSLMDGVYALEHARLPLRHPLGSLEMIRDSEMGRG